MDHFSRFARISDVDFAPVDLSALVRTVASYPGGPKDLGEITITMDLPDELLIQGDREKLDEALRSILQVFRWRARGSAPAAVRITGRRLDKNAEIILEDQTPATAEEVARWAGGGAQQLSQSAEFTMVMARSFVESHRGRVSLERSDLGGLRVRMQLPEK
jgi:two-component system sensor histidine kinase BaeS